MYIRSIVLTGIFSLFSVGFCEPVDYCNEMGAFGCTCKTDNSQSCRTWSDCDKWISWDRCCKNNRCVYGSSFRSWSGACDDYGEGCPGYDFDFYATYPGQNGGNYIKFDETWDSFTNDFNSGGIYANGTSVPEKTSGSLDAGTVYSSYKKGVMCLQKKGDSVKRVLFLPSAPYGRFSPKKLSFFYQKYNSVYPATADMKLLLPKCYTMPEVRECYDAASSSYLARVIPGIKAEIAKSTNPECKKAFRWL